MGTEQAVVGHADGDMLAAGVVFVGTHLIQRGVGAFARLNMVFVLLACGVAWLLLGEYRRLTAERPTAGA